MNNKVDDDLGVSFLSGIYMYEKFGFVSTYSK